MSWLRVHPYNQTVKVKISQVGRSKCDARTLLADVLQVVYGDFACTCTDFSGWIWYKKREHALNFSHFTFGERY